MVAWLEPSRDREEVCVDPERIPDEAANRARAARRARSCVRRYCLHNRLERLVTLTFRDEDLPGDRAGVHRAVAEWVVRMRQSGTDIGPYVLVVERGSRGRRLHAHIVIGRYVAAATIASCWGLGWVDVRRLLPRRRTSDARKFDPSVYAAWYVSKYVSKAFSEEEDADWGRGSHRYEVAEGFQPPALEFEMTGAELEAWLVHAESSVSSFQLDDASGLWLAGFGTCAPTQPP